MKPGTEKRSWGLVPAVLVLALAAMLIVCGCTTQPDGPTTMTPTATATTLATAVPTTPAPQGEGAMKVYNESANNSTVKISLGGDTIMVSLAENPTTGYSWNASVTKGLSIVNDTYLPGSQSQTMVGAGGTHSWILNGTAAGMQKFSAVYMRPWENVTEGAYVLNVLVESP